MVQPKKRDPAESSESPEAVSAPEDTRAPSEEPPVWERPWLPRRWWPIWFTVKRVTKAALQLVAIIAAVPVVAAAVIYLRDNTTDYQAYERLKNLAAGMTVVKLEEEIGEPWSVLRTTLPEAVSGEAVEVRDYIAPQYVVRSVSNTDGRVILLSVLTCKSSFHPRFITPSQSEIELGRDPIARAETAALDGPRSAGVDESRIRAVTSAHLAFLLDVRVADIDNTTDFRAYGLGYNAVCDPDFAVEAPDGSVIADFDSAVEPVSEVVASFRDTVSPNFYVETNDLGLSDDLVIFMLAPSDEDLPRWYLRQILDDQAS